MPKKQTWEDLGLQVQIIDEDEQLGELLGRIKGFYSLHSQPPIPSPFPPREKGDSNSSEKNVSLSCPLGIEREMSRNETEGLLTMDKNLNEVSPLGRDVTRNE